MRYPHVYVYCVLICVALVVLTTVYCVGEVTSVCICLRVVSGFLLIELLREPMATLLGGRNFGTSYSSETCWGKLGLIQFQVGSQLRKY